MSDHGNVSSIEIWRNSRVDLGEFPENRQGGRWGRQRKGRRSWGGGAGDGEKERERTVCLDRIRGRFIVEPKAHTMVKPIAQYGPFLHS